MTSFVALSIHLKRRQEIATTIAKERFRAYAALWARIPYSPELRKLKKLSALSPQELLQIFDSMTSWYYEEGNGMLLGRETRQVYFHVKSNLICAPADFAPSSAVIDDHLDDEERGRLCIRQLSLLRSAMRADLEIFGRPWGSDFGDEDRAFFRACKVRLSRIERKGWEERLGDRLIPDRRGSWVGRNRHAPA